MSRHCVLAAALVFAASAACGENHTGKVTWERDPAKGLAEAKQNDKAAMLFFSANW